MVISRAFIVTCSLLACIVIMIAFTSSSNVYGAKGNDVFDELSDFISLSDALKGSGGSSGGGRSSSSGSRSSSSSSSSRSSSRSSSSSTSSKSSRSSSRSSSKATSSKTTSTTSNKKNTAPANKVAAAYKQYAQSRVAGMKSVPTSKLAAAHKQYAQSRIAGMKASPKTARSALTGRFNAAFSKQATVNNGKLNANAIRASYQKQQNSKIAAAYKQYAQSRVAGMKSVPTSKLAAAHKQYAQSRIAGMKSVPTSTLAAAHKQYAQSRLSATNVKGYQIDKGLLGKLEGYKTTGYVPQDNKGNVIGKSGITIGTGFDLGQQTKASLEKLGLSKDLVDKLSPYTEKKQQAAKDFLAKNPLSLTEAQTQAIDKAVIDKYASSLAKDYETIAAQNPKSVQKFTDLPAAVQTVAYSVHHQYGSLSRTPNFREKLAKNDYQGMVNELKNFGDDYSTRRNTEAEHLSNSLKSEVRG